MLMKELVAVFCSVPFNCVLYHVEHLTGPCWLSKPRLGVFTVVEHMVGTTSSYHSNTVFAVT